MMKKIMIIFVTVLIFLISFYTYLLTSSNNETDNNTGITPTITPVETLINPTESITLSPQELKNIEIQKTADTNFGNWQKEIRDTKPWYDKLPLTTEKYFVYFDLEQNKFIAQIYDKNNQEAIKTEIIKSLKDSGIETDKYGFVW